MCVCEEEVLPDKKALPLPPLTLSHPPSTPHAHLPLPHTSLIPSLTPLSLSHLTSLRILPAIRCLTLQVYFYCNDTTLASPSLKPPSHHTHPSPPLHLTLPHPSLTLPHPSLTPSFCPQVSGTAYCVRTTTTPHTLLTPLTPHTPLPYISLSLTPLSLPSYLPHLPHPAPQVSGTA